MKMAAVTAEARTTVMAAIVLMTIALVALAMPTLSPNHIVANAIAHVVAIAITFVSM
jgi:hypothetical protein